MDADNLSLKYFSPASEHDIIDFVLIADHNICFAVPDNFPPDLIKNIFAGLKSYNYGSKSIDYVLKRYGGYWNFNTKLPKDKRLLKEVLGLVIVQVREALELIDVIEKKPDRVGIIAAEAAMRRLQTSFKSATILIKLGHYFESLNICRLILEQIAWACGVHELNDESIFKLQAPKTISKLKTILPEAGWLNGYLSEYAHITPHLTTNYVKSVDGRFSIKLITPKECMENAYILLLLTDMFIVISEYIFKDTHPYLTCFTKDKKGNYQIKKSRPFLKILNKYKNKLIEKEET